MTSSWLYTTNKYKIIVEQKCQKGQIGTLMLGTRWYKFYPRTPTVRATMHTVTDRRTDGQTDGQNPAGNSRSYCVTVRSAKKSIVHSCKILFLIHWSSCATNNYGAIQICISLKTVKQRHCLDLKKILLLGSCRR